MEAGDVVDHSGCGSHSHNHTLDSGGRAIGDDSDSHLLQLVRDVGALWANFM